LTLLEFNNFYTLFTSYQNIAVIAQLLFSKYAFFFLIAGLILLVAMIGAIVLTLNQSSQPAEWPYRKINMQLTQVLKLTNKKNIN